MAGSETVKFAAVGDITAFHKEPESGWEFVSSYLQQMDVVVGQNERHYSNRTDYTPVGIFTELTKPEHAKALKLGNFSVVTFASNHAMDLGPDIMMETIEVLRDLGFAVIGSGENIVEARKPAFVERNGTTVGFLAYCSVLRPNYQAGPTNHGIAPMRAYTHYLQTDFQPGTDPKILTFPYKEDLEAMLDDIRKAKATSDVLAVAMHWGLHGVRGALATYQKEVAYAAIDAGADMILGSHPHRLKAIEVYKGKPIFYSLGNFSFDQPRWVLEEGQKRSPEHAAHMAKFGWKWNPETDEWLATPIENRKSMIARIDIADKRLERVSFVPVMINNRAQPRMLSHDDEEFDEVVDYVKEITESQEIGTKYTVEGDEVVIGLS